MADQGFPNTHTTTTVVQPSDSKSSIRLDLSYLHTTEGRLKCAEIVCNLLGFICILSSLWKYESRANWFNTVAMGGFWFSGLMLAFFVFHVPENLKIIPWLNVEFVFCALWTFFYFIASILAITKDFDGAMTAAAVFGFFAVMLYGFDAFLKFRKLKEERNTVRTINMPPNADPTPRTPNTPHTPHTPAY